MNFNSIILNSSINNSLTLEKIIKSNATSQKFGIVLSERDITKLIEVQNESVKSTMRIEFGTGVIDKLNTAFCDSYYVYPGNYSSLLEDLIEMFYYFKNESFDILSDDELIKDMRMFFDKSHGSLELLQDSLLKEIDKNIKKKQTD